MLSTRSASCPAGICTGRVPHARGRCAQVRRRARARAAERGAAVRQQAAWPPMGAQTVMSSEGGNVLPLRRRPTVEPDYICGRSSGVGTR